MGGSRGGRKCFFHRLGQVVDLREGYDGAGGCEVDLQVRELRKVYRFWYILFSSVSVGVVWSLLLFPVVALVLSGDSCDAGISGKRRVLSCVIDVVDIIVAVTIAIAIAVDVVVVAWGGVVAIVASGGIVIVCTRAGCPA